MKITFITALFISIGFTAFSQTSPVEEPEYVGESVYVGADHAITPLEKQTVKIQTKAGASVYLVGIGKTRSKMVIQGNSSPVKLKSNELLTFIVKSFDNKSDPLSIVSIIKFQTTSKARKAEIGSLGTFSGASTNNLDYIKYTSKKFKESSYELKIEGLVAGEYGIIVKNPTALADNNTIVACFSVEE